MEHADAQSWGEAAAEAGTDPHKTAEEHQSQRHQGQEELGPPQVWRKRNKRVGVDPDYKHSLLKTFKLNMMCGPLTQRRSYNLIWRLKTTNSSVFCTFIKNSPNVWNSERGLLKQPEDESTHMFSAGLPRPCWSGEVCTWGWTAEEGWSSRSSSPSWTLKWTKTTRIQLSSCFKYHHCLKETVKQGQAVRTSSRS